MSKSKSKQKSHLDYKQNTLGVPQKRSLLGRIIVKLGNFISRRHLDIEVLNRENIPQNPPYVIIANHVTFVDAMWLFDILPPQHYARTCAMIGADLKTDYGLLGKLMFEAARAIPVDRKGLSAVRSLIAAKNALEAGNNILIHPEGTRSSDGNIAEFQSGSAYLGYKYAAPVLPVYIEGASEIWPRGQNLPSFRDAEGHKRKLRLHIGPCFYGADFTSAKQMNQYMYEAFLKKEAELRKQN